MAHTMTELPLRFIQDHPFLEIGGALWLFDTGAPTSFGGIPMLDLDDKRFNLESGCLGLTAKALSDLVSVDCVGLLGADILGCFDWILDAPNGNACLSPAEELRHDGTALEISEFMGIPIVPVEINGSRYPMFFDTGAQLSYFQDESLTTFPPAGRITDFYPGIGRFETDTFDVPVQLANCSFTLCCGTLPELLGLTLMMGGTEGIVGNSVMRERVMGYFPKRNLLIP